MNSQLKEYQQLMDMGNKYIELGNTINIYDMKETLDAWGKARIHFSRAQRLEQHISKDHYETQLSPAFEARTLFADRIEVGDEIVVDRAIRKVVAITEADDDPQYLTFDLEPDVNSRYVKEHAHRIKKVYFIGGYK